MCCSMCLIMTPVHAHDMWCCPWSWEPTFVCTLLLRNQSANILSNSHLGRSRENANVKVVDHIHGRPTMVYWRKQRNQTRPCVYVRRSALSCVMCRRSLFQFITRYIILRWGHETIVVCWYACVLLGSSCVLSCRVLSSYWWRRQLRNVWNRTHLLF